MADGLYSLAPTALLSTKEAAPLISLKQSTLETWRSRMPERGPRFIRLGKRGCIRYRVADLIEWIESAPMGGGRL